MTDINAIQQLPSGPPSLCFEKEEFMKGEFHVEQFVVSCRRRVPLETLRDDLAMYLKILQSAMIELINKDYADFVNLSTNLVGVDKALTSLMNPLSQLRDDVLSASAAMDEAMEEVHTKITEQRRIRQRKASLQQLMSIVKSVEKVEKLLGLSTDLGNQDRPREITGHLLERVGNEFNKLQFFVNKCQGTPLVDKIKPRVGLITDCLQQSLEGWLCQGLAAADAAALGPCLRTYATIDKAAEAHAIFRQRHVRPYMEQVISEERVYGEGGLAAMYDAILQFVPQHCRALLQVTTASGGPEAVQGFDFLVNAVWPEIVHNIEARTPSIFAPGNPHIFHEKYTCSVEFVARFERLCASQASVRRLRAHPSYNAFMAKWSLPVYFQIRFQEIAGAFETALTTPFVPAPEGSGFRLMATESVWRGLVACWLPEVFLPPLTHRFWKLTLQLLARYSSWLSGVLAQQQAGESGESKSAGGGGDGGEGGELCMENVVNLLADIHALTEDKVMGLYRETIVPQLAQLGVDNTDLLTEGLGESVRGLAALRPALSGRLVAELTAQCGGPIRLVNDLPRLYRRTNREVPTKSSSYLSGMMAPVESFVAEHGAALGEAATGELLHQVVSANTASYLSTTSDVLTSVKKMEESLKRLKKGKSSTALAAAGAAGGMSDDDKIRRQLQLDVQQLQTQISALGVESGSIEAFTKLRQMVEDAVSANNGNSS